MRQLMRQRLVIATSLAILATVLVATVMLGRHSFASPTDAAEASSTPISLRDLHALFFVWASGTPAVQQVAAQECAQLALSTTSCAQISAAVRAGWLDLASRDPSAVGRPDARPNLAGRAQALASLSAQLTSITNGRSAALVAATQSADALIRQPQWIQTHITAATSLPAGTVLVWATSYSQSSLPRGLNPKRSPYVALPDAYLKYANWGQISSIPSIYQPYYAPGGTVTNWSVNIATASGSRSVANVLITDVGPWNEDDNWWDANGSSAALPSACLVSGTLIAPDATSNALVNGICPNGANLRRVYYYLLYQHYGLPFFQPASYIPTGSFADAAGAGLCRGSRGFEDQ